MATLQLAKASVDGVRTVKDRSHHPAGTLRATVGIVAHDAMKADVALFCRAHRDLLERVSIMAPEDTAWVLEEIGLEVEFLKPDTRGGDLQLAAAVVDGRVDAVLFIQDPLVSLAGEPEIRGMMKVCDLEEIPLATNTATARIVLNYLADGRMLSEAPPGDPVEASRGGKVIRLDPLSGGDRGKRWRIRT